MSADTSPNPFRVVMTTDYFGNNDALKQYHKPSLALFDEQSHISYRKLAEYEPIITAEQLGDAHGVMVMAPAVTADTVNNAQNLLAVGRFGVGFDGVDVPACTEADVVLITTPGAVDRPVAEATVCFMLALTHQLRMKDQMVRQGRWDDKAHYMGCELRDRTFGAVGLGRIGQATVRLLAGFGMNQPLAFDPYADKAAAAALNVRLVDLDELLEHADFVSVHCPLTDDTRNLIGRREIGLMKSNAYLLNTARGGIVDEDALYEALDQNRIAGAGIDCFVGEPIIEPHRFGQLDNVILSPHGIAWTAEMFRDVGSAVCQAMVDLSLGRKPKGAVNPEVFDRPRFQSKWSAICGQ